MGGHIEPRSRRHVKISREVRDGRMRTDLDGICRAPGLSTRSGVPSIYIHQQGEYMKNFVLGSLFGSVVTGYLTGHIRITSQGIAFVPPVSSTSSTETETPPSPPTATETQSSFTTDAPS